METTNLSKIRREKMLNTISEIKKNITDENATNRYLQLTGLNK